MHSTETEEALRLGLEGPTLVSRGHTHYCSLQPMDCILGGKAASILCCRLRLAQPSIGEV
jgi:hypothetical protein